MRKYLLSICIIFFGGKVQAITPTFSVNQEINFGSVILTTGSCSMIPTTGALTYYQGMFICEFPKGAQNGSYTITANPNKIVQIKMKPNLDNGNGYMFNPKASVFSDVQQKVIYNNNDFVEINSGDSGIINIYLGGDLTVYNNIPSGQTINFTFDEAIEWNELD